MNARKLAEALAYCRRSYISNSNVFLVLPGTVITDNAETDDIDAPYTDDDEVTLQYEDGSVYVLSIEKSK